MILLAISLGLILIAVAILVIYVTVAAYIRIYEESFIFIIPALFFTGICIFMVHVGALYYSYYIYPYVLGR